jgi:predicted cation transporter
MKIKLLLTSIGGPLSLFVVRQLRKSQYFDIEIVGVDVRALDELPHELINEIYAYEVVPEGGDHSYAARIIDIAKKAQIDFILPCFA